jgi:hypothetical protein
MRDQDALQFSNCQRNASDWLIPVCVAFEVKLRLFFDDEKPRLGANWSASALTRAVPALCTFLQS